MILSDADILGSYFSFRTSLGSVFPVSVPVIGVDHAL